MSDQRLRIDATFLCIVLSLGLGPASTDMYLPGLPALALGFGVSDSTAQLTLTIFMVAFAVGHLVFGPLSDRYGRRPIVLTGVVLYSLSTSLCALAPAFIWLLLGRIGQALGAACCVVIARAIVRDVYGAKGSGRFMAYATAGMAIIASCSPTTGGLMMEHFGWQSIFWTLLGIILVLGATYGLCVPETLPLERREQGGFAEQAYAVKILLHEKRFVGYLLTSACVYSGMFAFISLSPYVFIKHLGAAPSTYGYLFTSLSLTYFTFTVIAGRVHNRYGSDPLIALGSALVLSGGLSMLVLNLLGFDSVWAVMAPQLICMVGLSFTLAQCFAAAVAPHPALAGSASAILGFGQMLMASLVVTIVGFLHSGGAFIMATAIALMGTLSVTAFRLLVLPATRAERMESKL